MLIEELPAIDGAPSEASDHREQLLDLKRHDGGMSIIPMPLPERGHDTPDRFEKELNSTIHRLRAGLGQREDFKRRGDHGVLLVDLNSEECRLVQCDP